VDKGILCRTEEGGRSTHYKLVENGTKPTMTKHTN
jgi:hypothetical protein